jgi:hypothetical protein
MRDPDTAFVESDSHLVAAVQVIATRLDKGEGSGDEMSGALLVCRAHEAESTLRALRYLADANAVFFALDRGKNVVHWGKVGVKPLQLDLSPMMIYLLLLQLAALSSGLSAADIVNRGVSVASILAADCVDEFNEAIEKVLSLLRTLPLLLCFHGREESPSMHTRVVGSSSSAKTKAPLIELRLQGSRATWLVTLHRARVFPTALDGGCWVCNCHLLVCVPNFGGQSLALGIDAQGVIGIGQDFSAHRKAFVDAAEQHERLLDSLQTSAIFCVDADGVRATLPPFIMPLV